MELAKYLLRTNVEPGQMVLCLLPVLPPKLRPTIQIDGGKSMSSDLNELYRRVIYWNNTLIDPLTTSRSMPGESMMCQEKLVQEVVGTLLDNGICKQPMRDDHNKVYKSFSDVIEGKQGRFRETLLGKRVDYSGRSVIEVGPSLSLHRCGLPREIAIELFQTFVIRGLITQYVASDIGIAKSKILEKEPIVWEILQKVMEGHPVLLNRAPTLHRLGIQSFQRIPVEGLAICLHPLVRKGFNADFDGDQMAVHVPLSLEAQAEARLLMFSHMNLLSPAIGDHISVPTQDMLIGLYVLTIGNRQGNCTNRYNPCHHKNYQNEIVDNNNYKYTKEKEPYFCSSYNKKKTRIELKISSGDIHFPGETDNISRYSGILLPPGRIKNTESKFKNWIYVQRIIPIKKKYFVLVRPIVTYEITDGINLSTFFPQDLLQEKNNLHLRVVNYIIYGDGKPIRGIFHKCIQLVRTCLVLNWDQCRDGSIEEEEAYTSLLEVRVNDLIRNFIRIDLVKSPI
ncbi:hypothetical protein AMTRI_Chr07g26520 [Amborella trichopoda]